MEEGDVKLIGGEWFMFMEYFSQCPHCEEEITESLWTNIDKAVKNISSQSSNKEKK